MARPSPSDWTDGERVITLIVRSATEKIALEESQERLEADLLERERQRRDALVANDMERFADLIEDDVVHVHTTGVVNDKAALLKHAGAFLEFLDIQRGPLTIRRLGPDAAIMTGSMTNFARRRGVDERVEVKAFVTQVWRRRDGIWRIASFHAVRAPDAA
jgi:uncharacterized protein (TIGR02246 family)